VPTSIKQHHRPIASVVVNAQRDVTVSSIVLDHHLFSGGTPDRVTSPIAPPCSARAHILRHFRTHDSPERSTTLTFSSRMAVGPEIVGASMPPVKALEQNDFVPCRATPRLCIITGACFHPERFRRRGSRDDRCSGYSTSGSKIAFVESSAPNCWRGPFPKNGRSDSLTFVERVRLRCYQFARPIQDQWPNGFSIMTRPSLPSVARFTPRPEIFRIVLELAGPSAK